MKLAIKFGDNDFTSTFEGVLKAFNEAYIHNEGSHKELDYTNKKNIAYIINNMSYAFFLMRQHKIPHFPITAQNTINYLQITEEQIYVDDEVDTLLYKTGNNRNYEIFILDTDLNYDNNSPVYAF